ncbi:Uncharacterised protein [uncultured archaeon]|nr:Uncharacterised protein [uncultured archaeon]
MELTPVEIGLIPVIVAALLGPLLFDKVERNIEAFLLMMGVCAVIVSRSWHIGLMEDAAREPIVIGTVLSVLLAGLIIHYWRPQSLHCIDEILSYGITMKVIFLEIVVVLGLSAAIISPILSFFVLVEVVTHLPIGRRTRANLTILACLSIILGAGLSLMQEPSSAIAVMKMQEALPSANPLPLELQSLYIPCIVALGIISIFFAGEKVNALKTGISEGAAAFRSGAIWSARVCMFAGALLLVGVAFGVGF